jgi:hypothetical protein
MVKTKTIDRALNTRKVQAMMVIERGRLVIYVTI